MVKPDPALQWLGVAVGLQAIVALIFTVPVITLLFAYSALGALSLAILPLFVVIAGLLWYQFYLYVVPLINLRLQEQRRTDAAAASMQHRLALVGQPMPTLPPLSVPLTLRLRPNWQLMALICGFLAVLSAGSYLVDIIMPDSLVTLSFVFVGPIGALLVLIMLPIFTLAWRQRIDVTPFGIMVQRGTRSTSILWETAALFAQINATPTRRESERVTRYELSDIQAILRFIVPRTRWSPMLPQGMSLADYDHQMALLMQYIAVRTGLPLVDVR